METPSWFEPFKKLIEKIADALFGKKPVLAPITISRTPLWGDKGEHVRVLQVRLNENGAELALDGDFGAKTRSAVSVFQKSKGLAGSGVLGPKTLEFLGIEIVGPTGDVNQRVWDIAYGEFGVREESGAKHNPRILEYHATTGGFGDDETPWCSSFVQWVLKQAGIQGTGSASARSWMNFGVATSQPEKGDIVVFWRGSKSGWQGHVGFYSHQTASHVYTLGGNQSNGVNISPYSKNQLLGYRTYKAGV